MGLTGSDSACCMGMYGTGCEREHGKLRCNEALYSDARASNASHKQSQPLFALDLIKNKYYLIPRSKRRGVSSLIRNGRLLRHA